MPRECQGEGCETLIADDMEFCSVCRDKEREIQVTMAANWLKLQKRLEGERRFAAWLNDHPEYE